MIRCPRCDAPSTVDKDVEEGARRLVTIYRECSNGHTFVTKEVHTTMVADARELRSALGKINRRIALWNRDCAILRDKRSAEAVAVAYNITAARVRQIRASGWEWEDAPAARKIRSSTQKGK